MKLSDAEQCELNRKFEEHFDIKLPQGCKINVRLCDGLRRGKGGLQARETFAMLFGVNLACSEPRAAQLCEEWFDKLTYFLLSVELNKGEAKK